MSLQTILNFLPVDISRPDRAPQQIGTAGQPTAEEFAAIRDAGYQVVVNLAPSNSSNAIEQEKEIVESLGMQYVHIPVKWENPAIEDLDQFFQVMTANTDQSIFVHCAKNMRVSAFVYLYRQTHQLADGEQAKRDLHQIWQPNQTWQEFIETALRTHRNAEGIAAHDRLPCE